MIYLVQVKDRKGNQKEEFKIIVNGKLTENKIITKIKRFTAGRYDKDILEIKEWKNGFITKDIKSQE